MIQRFWLASYPKSGNTWFRMLVANLRSDAPADINRLPPAPSIASARGPIDTLSLIASGLLTHEECDRLRPAVYRAMASMDAPDAEAVGDAIGDMALVKTHDAWTHNADGDPLMGGASAAAGAILIVRDPRDIVASLANHNGEDIEATIAFMADPSATFAGRRDGQSPQLRQRLLDWSAFQASWLDQREIPVHIVHYEALQADPAMVLMQALAFAGVSVSPQAAARAAAFSDFAQLKAQEAEHGFGEGPNPQPGGSFFRRGVSGGWRDELTADQARRVASDHHAMMVRLGYAIPTRRRQWS